MKIFSILTFAIALFIAQLFPQEISPLPRSIYDVTERTIDGREIPFALFSGKVLLIVNVASDDPQSSQLEGLKALQEKYESKGFYVLAFPSSDFTPSEPTNPQALQAIYYDKDHVNFFVFENSHVTGTYKIPLYAFLTNGRSDPAYGIPILWNYDKFLVGKDGAVVDRFPTTTKPDDPRLIKAIEKALGTT